MSRFLTRVRLTTSYFTQGRGAVEEGTRASARTFSQIRWVVIVHIAGKLTAAKARTHPRQRRTGSVRAVAGHANLLELIFVFCICSAAEASVTTQEGTGGRRGGGYEARAR